MAEHYSYRTKSMERMIKRRKRMAAAFIGLAAVLIVVIIILVIVNASGKSSETDSDKNISGSTVDEESGKKSDDAGYINDGVYIETVSVGGMDYNTAVKDVEKLIDTVMAKKININVNGAVLSASLKELGVSCDKEELVDKAFALEEEGTINIDFSIDESKLSKIFEDEEGTYTKKAKNASLKRVNGAFKVIKGKNGKEIDIEATKTAIITEINNNAVNNSEMNVDAVIKNVEPEYTAADLAKCKDVLGKFSTSYKESMVQRSANVKNAVSFINGKVVYPGDTLSVADTIYPLTSDNGYLEAPSYAGGQVVDSLGGGVCQVSTTLYNAVLLSELEIVERSPHSMVVSYVKPSMDAAIAGDYKDLKFKNNTDVPIYIQGSAGGGILTFTIYGMETRPSSRKIQYVSDVVETIQPGKDIVTEDKTLPESYRKVTQTAHVGYVANLYKVVYENGVEVSREKINYSRYKAVPQYVTVGTKKEKKDKDKDKDKNKDKKDKDKDKEDNDDDKKDNDNPDSDVTSPDSATTDPSQDVTPQEPVVTEAPVQTPVDNPGV
ncbi:MAG: hypothetical protein HFH14_05225 [Lachnospiraceae bacterium]|nr:hypothetical protein [Lachnospiraceae bacterium]